MLIKVAGHILQCERDLSFLFLGNNNTLLTVPGVPMWQFQERARQPHTDRIFTCSVLCGMPKENEHPREQSHSAVILRRVFTAPPVWTGLYTNAQWVSKLIYTTENVLIWVMCLHQWHYKHGVWYSRSYRISINVSSVALKLFMSSFLQMEEKYLSVHKKKVLFTENKTQKHQKHQTPCAQGK